MQATLKQLRRETGAFVRAVQRGERVIVTDRGRPVVEMRPVHGNAEVKPSDDLFGIWSDHEAMGSVANYMTKVRKGRVE